MKISPARTASYEILKRIESERSFSSVLLPAYEAELSDADKGLCHQLTLGVLRRQLFLDRAIEHFAGGRRMDLAVRLALRLGAFQLLFLDKVPPYSAINESVNLVQRAKKTSAKPFVNAILRRISQNLPTFEFAGEVERISVETSHPAWLIDRWIREFGREQAEQIAASNNVHPRIAFRITREEARPDVSGFTKSDIADGCLLADGFDKRLRQLGDEGSVYFQDEASQLVGNVVAGDLGSRFLDVCAAPGGKTSLVAAKAAQDVLIIAGDLHPARVQTLSETSGRFGHGRVNVIRYDAEAVLPFADQTFDTVLVDAPCSGTGTIRHNPEIRYFLVPEDFGELANKQRTILGNASKAVRPGGRLIYSTCSLEFDENEEVCTAFLESSPDFGGAVVQVPSRLHTNDGFARTFPYRDGTDGFFIAEFRRRR